MWIEWIIYIVAGLVVTAVGLAGLLYLLFYFSCLVVGILAAIFADRWSVDPDDPEGRREKLIDPENTNGKKRRVQILRKIAPAQVVYTTLAENPIYGNYARNTRFALRALADGRAPRKGVAHDFDLVTLPDGTETGADPIASRWGWLDPVYVLRRLVYTISGRHVVRIHFPFVVAGIELYSPFLFTYERGKPFAQVKEQQAEVAPKNEDAGIVMVRDVSDHVRRLFRHVIVTPGFPVAEGFSITFVIELWLRATNVSRFFLYPDWSPTLNAQVNSATGTMVRGGKLSSAYALERSGAKKQGEVANTVSKNVIDALTKNNEKFGVPDPSDPSDPSRRISFLERLGLELELLTVVDVNSVDAAKIAELMSIAYKGHQEAEATGALAGAIKEVVGPQQIGETLSLLELAKNQGVKVSIFPGAAGNPTRQLLGVIDQQEGGN